MYQETIKNPEVKIRSSSTKNKKTFQGAQYLDQWQHRGWFRCEGSSREYGAFWWLPGGPVKLGNHGMEACDNNLKTVEWPKNSGFPRLLLNIVICSEFGTVSRKKFIVGTHRAGSKNLQSGCRCLCRIKEYKGNGRFNLWSW